MKTIKIGMIALFLLLIGCATFETGPALRGVVTYSVTNNSPIVISAKTPFDRVPENREAYLFWFKRGFSDAIQQKVVLISWERNHKGDAGASGYAHGLEEGSIYRTKHSVEK